MKNNNKRTNQSSKKCSLCEIIKDLENFYKDRGKRDGHSHWCKDCTRLRNRKWREDNRERKRASNLKYERENKDKKKRWHKKYQQTHRSDVRANTSRYRAKKKQATPSWANFDRIQEIYLMACEEGLEVDHIVPLQSEYVCGLHCEDNLQCVDSSYNRKKNNNFWPDMP